MKAKQETIDGSPHLFRSGKSLQKNPAVCIADVDRGPPGGTIKRTGECRA